ncbi:MAG: TonB-dependent receptor [Microscillaceae bacterium]|nr:TonB-dependent receptor [Microscillaceae bacterium]
MKKNYCFILFFLALLSFGPLLAQETLIKGQVKDAKTGEALIGVNITLKDKVTGTTSDVQGNFVLKTKTPPPFTLIFSSIGYRMTEIEVSEANALLTIQLEEETLLGREIIVAASRYEESVLESPVSIERLGILEIRNTSAANFYDALRNLKGVDMGQQSLLFITPNTRGFNGNTNYRVTQYIDGIDNAPPGLNFPAGNIVGSSQLDVESVELLVGASSALYGPGGVNGTILVSSKNPFDYQGLSASLQTGAMHLGANYRDQPAGMYEFNLRYAKALNDRFAFKINFGYLTALDWHATDFRDNNNLNGPNADHNSSSGYDGVHTYGDESFADVDLSDDAIRIPTAEGYAAAQGFAPGTPEYQAAFQQAFNLFPTQSTVITRTGYQERNLADYNTESLKGGISLHYRLTENVEMLAQGGFGRGTSVYTASNRFSLVDFTLYSAKLEVRGPKFFVRLWSVGENAGDSYDVGTTASQINESWKTSENWYADFIASYTTARLLGNPQEVALISARYTADNRDANNNIINPTLPYRWLPGEPRFEQALNQITSRPVTETFPALETGNTIRGTRVIDKSQMYNVEAMYNFSDFFKFADILAGMSYRIYRINSEGTIFGDPLGDPHDIREFGAYVQVSKKMLGDRLKFNGTARYDKNSNFEGRFTPRASVVYTLDAKKRHFLRGSAQTAFRFPSMADQFTNLNVGIFQVIGGLPRFRPGGLAENPVYPLDSPNPITGQPDLSQDEYVFPEFRPERVVAWEIGYKGLFDKNVLLDFYAYYNTYNGFIANQAFGRFREDGSPEKFLSAVSLDQEVSAYGWALSLDYQGPRGYVVSGNIAYNELDRSNLPPGFQSRFNAPDYRTNISLSNRNVYKNAGFSLTWHWQNDFVWESTFGVGDVPAYHTLDAQISYKMSKLKTIVKLGAVNLLNQYYTTGFGNPEIGGLYYLSLTFDQLLN